MALSASTLATELKALSNPPDEATLKNDWSTAWNTYWEESEATYLTTVVGANSAPAAAVTAFKAGLTGLSNDQNTETQAATIIKDAIKAFWTAATPLLSYGTSPAPAPGTYVLAPPFMLTPASEAAFVTALAAVFTANAANKSSKEDSLDAVAAAMHAGQQGATFLDTTTPSSGGPFTYTVT
jgi:hypothetical protein